VRLRLFLTMSLVLFSWPAEATPELWAALKQGEAAALMRHALAPGTGDPAGFDLRDCATQRTLNSAGRRQARAIGEVFRANGVAEAEVRTSEWCRCQETAALLGLGPAVPLPALNSFFQDRSERALRTRALKEFLSARAGERPLVLVTHQVNITALTDIFPQSGEIVFVAVPAGADEPVRVLGRLLPAPP